MPERISRILGVDQSDGASGLTYPITYRHRPMKRRQHFGSRTVKRHVNQLITSDFRGTAYGVDVLEGLVEFLPVKIE